MAVSSSYAPLFSTGPNTRHTHSIVYLCLVGQDVYAIAPTANGVL